MSIYQWLTNIDRPFAFLLVLPFLVGLAALVSEYLRKPRPGDHDQAARGAGSQERPGGPGADRGAGALSR